MTRARRDPNSKKQWIGVRANAGTTKGRVAFSFLNESGGNIRLGFSTADATIELGMDDRSFGYGGTGTKSHGGEYHKFGQTYGKGDTVTCLLDMDRHTVSYMVNGRLLPENPAFSIGKYLWDEAFFPHVLVKEATFEVYFGPNQGCPPINIDPPLLPEGYQWIDGVADVMNPHSRPGEPIFVDESAAKEATEAALQKMMTSMARNQACHREQFEEWKVRVNEYARHFQKPLALEYQAEKDQVRNRVEKETPQKLIKNGYACFDMKAQFTSETQKRGADVMLLELFPARGRLPHVAEISIGRVVLITPQEKTPSLTDPETTIHGEVENIGADGILVSTEYAKLPRPARSGLYRCDLGPNIATFARIDMMIDILQRAEPAHVGGRMGIVNPGTSVANSLFADMTETVTAAQKWDPSTRPVPDPDAPVSRAAREKHAPSPPRPPKGQVPKMRQLNSTQLKALEMVLQEERQLSFIQGPPGTGKTTTAVEIIIGWLSQNKGPILATAFSNKGCDNLAEGLHNRGVNVLRVGHADPRAPYSMEAHLERKGGGKGGKKGRGTGLDKQLVREADVIAATCIGSGMKLLRDLEFHFVVVDEAAQIIEPACLIPISRGSRQVVMVGDQCQLPATVISNDAQKLGLDVSLFERMLTIGMEVHMLGVQYRMHPLISHFPSWRFYRGALRTGIKAADRVHNYGFVSQPVVFCNVDGREESLGSSKMNYEEAAAVSAVVQLLVNKKNVAPEDIGVITPYAAQVKAIERNLKAVMKDDYLVNSMRISSVDAFQGSENEVIILSMVRSNVQGNIGFVADWRRLNVALTRAKRLCLIFGNLHTLCQSPLWVDWVGFHASLPTKSVDWRTWASSEGMIFLENDPKCHGIVMQAQKEFAEKDQKDIQKALPIRGQYPGQSIDEKKIRAAEEEEIQRRKEQQTKDPKKAEEVATIRPQYEDRQKKAMQTGDDVMDMWLKERLREMEEHILKNSGRGNWAQYSAFITSFGMSLKERSEVEKRIDEADGNAYSKEEFIECYGGTEEWERSKPAPKSTVGHTVQQQQAAQPAASAPSSGLLNQVQAKMQEDHARQQVDTARMSVQHAEQQLNLAENMCSSQRSQVNMTQQQLDQAKHNVEEAKKKASEIQSNAQGYMQQREQVVNSLNQLSAYLQQPQVYGNPVMYQQYQMQHVQLQQSLANLEGNIRALYNQIEPYNKTIAQEEQEIQRRQQQLNDQNAQLNQLNLQVQQQKTALEQNKLTLQNAETALRAAQQLVACGQGTGSQQQSMQQTSPQYQAPPAQQPPPPQQQQAYRPPQQQQQQPQRQQAYQPPVQQQQQQQQPQRQQAYQPPVQQPPPRASQPSAPAPAPAAAPAPAPKAKKPVELTAAEHELVERIAKASTEEEVRLLEKQLSETQKAARIKRMEEMKAGGGSKQPQATVSVTTAKVVETNQGETHVAAVTTVERRIDPTDMKAYTKEEFIECYGGTAEWDAAASVQLPQRQRGRQKR